MTSYFHSVVFYYFEPNQIWRAIAAQDICFFFKSNEIIPEALQLPEYQNRIKKSLFRSEDTALQN